MHGTVGGLPASIGRPSGKNERVKRAERGRNGLKEEKEGERISRPAEPLSHLAILLTGVTEVLGACAARSALIKRRHR